MASLLRTGLHVVRRDDRHLQIGLDPPWRVVAPDEPGVRLALAQLEAGRAPQPDGTAAHRLLADLRRAGMLRPATQATEHTKHPKHTGSVHLAGTSVLAAQAVRLIESGPARVVEESAYADVSLVLAVGEPDRTLVDDLVRDGVAHLVVGGGARGYRVGPFVEPGRTACLRCVDAHHAERDPRRPVVLEQLSGLATAPADTALVALALAWAVLDVHRYLRGEQPSTWSATVDVDLHPDQHLEGSASAVPCRWSRHPHCGCSWASSAEVN